MSRDDFEQGLASIVEAIGDRPVDETLKDFLDEKFPPASELFQTIEKACHEGVAEGWLCEREHGGIKFGRPVKPGGVTGVFSVDVVHMNDIKGPHHRHPNGEIDMIMPIDAGAKFDSHGRGWCVYGPGSAHYPTVSGGAALVLYLLPDGAIEFTGQ